MSFYRRDLTPAQPDQISTLNHFDDRRREAWRRRAALVIGLVLGLATGFWSRQFTNMWPAAAVLDIGVAIYFALCLFHLQRRARIAIPLVTSALLLPPLAGMLKYQYLFAPATFSDLFEVSGLVRHYGLYGWIIVALCGAIMLVMCGLFCWNLRRPGWVGILLWVPALAFWLMVAAKLALPFAIADSLPSVPVLGRGLVSMPPPVLFGNWTSFLRSALVYADRIPMIARMRGAAQPDFGFIDDTLTDPARRNVYYIVLESFMDPLAIKGARYSPDPFAPLFQHWRGESGLRGQSPVFGNRSAESEFEILCGLPVTFEGAPVVFPQITAAEVDCLPRKLARLGWHTDSRTIADPRLYNYGLIYPKLGFQDRYFADSLSTDDVDELDNPSAAAVLSLHQQHIDDLLRDGRPFFTYLFGTFGHIPYGLDPNKRPSVIATNDPGIDLTAYANNVHYTSLEVAGFVDKVLAKDPAALIVAMGDHHPILRDLGDGIDYPGDTLARQDVPLLIIDGTKGFVPLHGRLPLYEVPSVVADILTGGKFCQQNHCSLRHDPALRPLPEAMLVTDRMTQMTVDCFREAHNPLCRPVEKRVAGYQAALATFLGDQ